ncbi:MAG: ABC transporter substrate-binding protein [Planctomycetales bacterium]|nr:ABC transporter substrate-binding protein [Planctomycetales bacterium]MCA9166361.1 ABC transporter substrate-binding protein [Planctomycetales bacterium]
MTTDRIQRPLGMSGSRSHIVIDTRIFCYLIGLVLACGCGRVPEPPLRIAINVWAGYECLFLAKELGYFEQEGVDVELVELTSLSDVRRAFERGQVDGIAATLTEVLQAREFSPRRLQIALICDFSAGADAIVAKSGINDVAALRGKRVGVEPASLGDYLLTRALESQQMSADDVQITPLNQQDMLEAYSTGVVDAIVTYPPVSIDAERFGGTTIFNSQQIPMEIVDIVAFDRDSPRCETEHIAAFVRSWDRAVAYMRDKPQHAYEIMAARQGVSPDDFAASLNGISIMTSTAQLEAWHPAGALQQAVTTVEQVLRRAGTLQGPSCKQDLLDPRFVVKAEVAP